MRPHQAVSPFLVVVLLTTPALGQETAQKGIDAPQNAVSGLVSIEVEKAKPQGCAAPPLGPLLQSDGCLDPLNRLSLDWLFPITPLGQRVVVSKGIGFIARADGVVVTSHDLVVGADRITVILLEGQRRTGKVVSVHPGTNTAVLRIEGNGLPTLAVRGSPELIPGARLSLAICCRLACSKEGCRHAAGAFMGRARSGDLEAGSLIVLFSEALTTLPGGPLLNEKGEVVGLNIRFRPVSLPMTGALPLQFAYATPADTARRLVGEVPFRAPLTPKFSFDGLDWDWDSLFPNLDLPLRPFQD